MQLRSRIVLSTAVVCLLLVPGAMAQNRPQCLPAPTGPGACFIDGSIFPSVTFNGVDLDGDFIQMTIPSSPDDFFNFRPNGRVSVHLTDSDATFTVCPATAPASCSTDGSGALTGTGRVQVNAFLLPGGVVSCPASITASAALGGDTDAFDMTYSLVTVPGPSGCRTIVDDVRVTLAD